MLPCAPTAQGNKKGRETIFPRVKKEENREKEYTDTTREKRGTEGRETLKGELHGGGGFGRVAGPTETVFVCLIAGPLVHAIRAEPNHLCDTAEESVTGGVVYP